MHNIFYSIKDTFPYTLTNIIDELYTNVKMD